MISSFVSSMGELYAEQGPYRIIPISQIGEAP